MRFTTLKSLKSLKVYFFKDLTENFNEVCVQK
jgi:hypothetical protein